MVIAYVRDDSKVILRCPNPRCLCNREKRLDVTRFFPRHNEIGKTIRCPQCSTLIPVEGIRMKPMMFC